MKCRRTHGRFVQNLHRVLICNLVLPKRFFQRPEGQVLPLAEHHEVDVTGHRTHAQRCWKKQEPVLVLTRICVYTLMMKGTPEWLYTLYSVSADITPTKTQSYIMIFGAGDITVINSKMKQKQVTIFICCFQNLQKSFSLVLMIKRPGNILHTIK